MGVGTNNLIKKGAKLVTCINDILKEFNVTVSKEEEFIQDWKYLNKQVPVEYKKVYDVLEYMPMDINTICTKSKLPIQEVSEKLTMLELEDYIQVLPGNVFVKIWNF